MARTSLQYTIRGRVPRIDFGKIAHHILDKKYELSVVLVGDALMQKLNHEHRKKRYPTNVLAFPISKDEGEIFINVRKAENEARALSIRAKERIVYLFIHACLHLKGFRHGKKMDELEKRIMKKVIKSI